MVIIVIRKNICILTTPKTRTGFGHGWALIPFKSPCSITIIFWDSPKKSKYQILYSQSTFPYISHFPSLSIAMALTCPGWKNAQPWSCTSKLLSELLPPETSVPRCFAVARLGGFHSQWGSPKSQMLHGAGIFTYITG